jgi:crotonobetainyl-CoA:carnitine CoA-transferase CaiB-like acyl-CoA transferase
MGALAGIEVIDFSTLLPGPLATLLLAEAGATVTKIERPGTGDEMRSYEPRLGTTSVNFALLNRGKRSLQLDLKSPGARATLQPLLERADVLVEQFRPGVMDRLGLGYDAVAAINPRLVYCSITGYGRDGDRAARAAHDLNYVGDAGLLDLVAGRDGDPVLPPVLVADIGGGAYPAVINILLAIVERQSTGRGRRIDVAMADNVLTWMYWAIGNGLGAGRWPHRGEELLTGGSPRYRLYRTADGRHVAAAPLEDRFWANFCALIDLPAELRDDRGDPAATGAAVAELIAHGTAAEWEARFARADVCCSIVRTVQEATEDPAFAARGLFAQVTGDGAGAAMPALPVPIDPALRGLDRRATAPRLEHEGTSGSPADGAAGR